MYKEEASTKPQAAKVAINALLLAAVIALGLVTFSLDTGNTADDQRPGDRRVNGQRDAGNIYVGDNTEYLASGAVAQSGSASSSIAWIISSNIGVSGAFRVVTCVFWQLNW